MITTSQCSNNEGIGHRAPREKLIKLGHLICGSISDGESPMEVAKSLYDSADLSQHDAETLVGPAIAAYCPQFNPRIP